MIGVDSASPVRTSTTTKVQIKEFTVPANARQIKAFQPHVVQDIPTANESVIVNFSITSDDLPFQPANFMAAPLQPLLGTTGCLPGVKQPIYPLNMPCNGGEKLQLNATALKTNTNEPLVGATIYYDTDKPTLPTLHGKIGTLTQTGTAAAEAQDTTPLAINGATVLEMAYGVVGYRTLVAAKPYIGRGKIVTADLSPPFPLTFPIASIQGVLSTAGIAYTPEINFADVSLAFKGNATLTLSHLLDNALSTTADFVIGTIYQ